MSHDEHSAQPDPDPRPTNEGYSLAQFLEYALTQTQVSGSVDGAVQTLAVGLARSAGAVIVLGLTDGLPPHEAAWGVPESDLKRLADHIRQRGRFALAPQQGRVQFLIVTDPGDWLLLPPSRRERFSSGILASVPSPRGGRVLLAAFVEGPPVDDAESALFRGVGLGLALALRQSQTGHDSLGTEAVPLQSDGHLGQRRPMAGDPAGGRPATAAARTAVADLSSPLTENSIAGIYIRQGNLIVLCNSRFAEMFGYAKEELCGAPLDRVMAVDPSPDEALAASAEHCHTVLGGEVVAGRNRRGQGLWLWTQSWEIQYAGSPVILGNVIDITAQVRSAMALRRSELELRVLSDELLATQENERKRIAGELHDGLGQQLTAIKFGVQSILSELRPQLPESYIERLGRLVDRIQDAVEDVRRISMALRPSMLDDLGITATISWFCREFQTVFRDLEIIRQVEVSEEDVHDTLKVVIFRILQETFNNIGKHAQARRARLRLERHRDRIRLMIADDGRGFDPVECAKERRGFGLNSMRERARLSGGRLRIMSRPGRGTLVLAVWKMRD